MWIDWQGVCVGVWQGACVWVCDRVREGNVMVHVVVIKDGPGISREASIKVVINSNISALATLIALYNTKRVAMGPCAAQAAVICSLYNRYTCKISMKICPN